MQKLQKTIKIYVIKRFIYLTPPPKMNNYPLKIVYKTSTGIVNWGVYKTKKGAIKALNSKKIKDTAKKYNWQFKIVPNPK